MFDLPDCHRYRNRVALTVRLAVTGVMPAILDEPPKPDAQFGRLEGYLSPSRLGVRSCLRLVPN